MQLMALSKCHILAVDSSLAEHGYNKTTVLKLIGSESAVRKKWVRQPKDLLTLNILLHLNTAFVNTSSFVFKG